MKNNFIFNRYWSDKKLFFTEKKRKLLKYKSINYYTTNFQRPLLFPVNDYKYSYPHLTNFEINQNFYLNEQENNEYYNFTIDCPELDKFSINYEQEIIKEIEEKHSSIIIYNVCMVKRTHHIKGKLFALHKDGLITKLFFYSFPCDIAKNIPCCNVTKDFQHLNYKKENICFGGIFVCPEKDMNIKIVIDLSNVRLILQRIYFYRRTAIEIFTNTKCYFFNFEDNVEKCKNFILMMSTYFYFTKEFFPINIKNETIGYSRIFSEGLKKYVEEGGNKNIDLKLFDNKFIRKILEDWYSSNNDFKFSTFDIIIFLNILSNRSYIDLFQYPVFPLLFYYEKKENNNYILTPRDLKNH